MKPLRGLENSVSQRTLVEHNILKDLALWRRKYFLILAHSLYKIWIMQEPNKLALWNKLRFEEKKNREYRACLKYSVPIFVE